MLISVPHEHRNKMENYFVSIPEEVMRWEIVEQESDFSLDEDAKNENNIVNNRPEQTVQSLQRDYISLYGSHPKMEDRIYSTCGVCEQVFNPHTVSIHKENCPGKGKIQLQHLKKKVKSKKKLQSSSVPLPPLFKKELPIVPVCPRNPEVPVGRDMPLLTDTDINLNVTVTTSKVPSEVAEPRLSPVPKSPPQPMSPLLFPDEEPPPPSSATTTSSNPQSSTSKHKKSKKSSKTLREYDPDVHCGVVEGQRGPCTRSITCSNHKIQLRKSVPGRSKDIHLLIAERKAAKEKETRRRSPSRSLTLEQRAPKEYIFPLVESPPITCDLVQENANEVANFVAASARVPPLPDLSENDLHDETEIDDSVNQLESGYCSIETISSTKSSPVIYYNPISPIFVVTPVQFVQKENNLFVESPQPVLSPSLPNGSYFLSIPDQTANIKFYKSHPKPAILPSYGVRKVGGAILSSNQRLEYQRSDIQMAINTKRKATSSTSCKNATYNVPPQRSILLKTKGINKVNCKRTSTEKNNGSDSKQIKLSGEVNGFILHTDMSEVADAPHNCIQENINLLNMK